MAFLYCTVCRRVAEQDAVMCAFCNTGFTSQLGCGSCGKAVPRGMSHCAYCVPQPPQKTELVPQRPSQELAMPFLPPLEISVPAPIPTSYVSRKFGVEARVTMNGNDAEIMSNMGNTAALLLALANQMNNFQGLAQSTRNLIKSCRNLATDIQEEIEVRRGPQGS